MAQLIRSAKTGANWSTYELQAYNIAVVLTSPAKFFISDPDPPLNHLDPLLLSLPANAGDDPGLSFPAAEYLNYLNFATSAYQKSSIEDFAAATMRFLGFTSTTITASSRYPIDLQICGKAKSALPTIVLLHQPSFTILIVVIQDKTLVNPTAGDAEAQVVAAGIAAFQHNNIVRTSASKPALDSMTIPCIIMSDTTPLFYLVPVTKELSNAVATGQYPVAQTQVSLCVTSTTPPRRIGQGMADPEFRKIALRRFLAFKDLARSHWEKFLV